MSFTIKPATRHGVKPLICAYSESGCGKTMSALILARGFAGPSGKIVGIDSESGRMSLYADVSPIGVYSTIDLDEPFSPSRYIEAIDAVENAGADIGIIDSGSHEWEGAGGVLDMAGEIEERTKKAGLHCWRNPKLEHSKFVQRLLRSKIPWIVCLRAKYKSRQTKDGNGKTQIVKDDKTSPLQAEDFIFEATAHFEILPDHSILLTKCSHPTLRDCFPKEGPITIAHGQKLAAWCNGTSLPASSSKTPDLTTSDGCKKYLWKLLREATGAEVNLTSAEAWLRQYKILPANLTLTQLTVAEIKVAIEKVEVHLNDVPTP